MSLHHLFVRQELQISLFNQVIRLLLEHLDDVLSLVVLFDACNEDFVFQVGHLHFHNDALYFTQFLVKDLSLVGRLIIFVSRSTIAATYGSKAREDTILGVDTPDLERRDVSLLSLLNF